MDEYDFYDEFQEEEISGERPSFDELVSALREDELKNVASHTVLYGLSDIEPQRAEELRSIWSQLRPDYRRKVMRMLAGLSETNFELDYTGIGFIGLDDDDSGVRQSAIHVLWIDTSIEFMDRLIHFASRDVSTEVRVAAIIELGRFIGLGELEELPAQQTTRAQETVIQLMNNRSESTEIRRRALEAIANSSHAIVTPKIQESYNSPEQKMRVSAIFAMGRSCNPVWTPIILKELDSGDPEIQYEAARSAGELAIRPAVQQLAKLALAKDPDVRHVAIWALGEIGGSEAIEVLEALEATCADHEDEELLIAIEEAIANAHFMTGILTKIDDLLDNSGDGE